MDILIIEKIENNFFGFRMLEVENLQSPRCVTFCGTPCIFETTSTGCAGCTACQPRCLGVILELDYVILEHYADVEQIYRYI